MRVQITVPTHPGGTEAYCKFFRKINLQLWYVNDVLKSLIHGSTYKTSAYVALVKKCNADFLYFIMVMIRVCFRKRCAHNFFFDNLYVLRYEVNTPNVLYRSIIVICISQMIKRCIHLT